MRNKKQKDIDLNENEITEEEKINNEEVNEENSDKKISGAEISETNEKYDELNNRYLRLQADFINYKKRNEKEKESIYTYAKSAIISDCLNALDNFERAFSTIDEDFKENSFYKGIEMVYKQMLEALSKNGMEEIEALNSKFDPTFHYAVMQEESEDIEPDTVIDVLQKGYKISDKVIRPSMVKVSK